MWCCSIVMNKFLSRFLMRRNNVRRSPRFYNSNSFRIIFLVFLVFLLLSKCLIITDIHNWDSNTSLDLKVYIKPNEPTTLINPNIVLPSETWVHFFRKELFIHTYVHLYDISLNLSERVIYNCWFQRLPSFAPF